jgi:hypothetical protein
MCGRGYSQQQLPPLAVRIAVVGAVITDPCVSSKPVVKGTARWAVGAAEENRHRTKRRTLEAHAGGNALPRLGAVDNIHVKRGRRPVSSIVYPALPIPPGRLRGHGYPRQADFGGIPVARIVLPKG